MFSSAFSALPAEHLNLFHEVIHLCLRLYIIIIFFLFVRQCVAEYSLPDMRYSPFGSTARLVTESRWATIEWISLPLN